MFKILKRNDGVSLIELITVMVISTILIVVSALGVSAFYKKYKVITDYVALQTDAMACLQTIRNGYGFNRGENFYGVANAKKVQIINQTYGVGSGIRITPPADRAQLETNWVTFYLDEGVVRMNYFYNGVQVDSPRYIFPAREDKDRIKVTRFDVRDANLDGAILPLDSFDAADIPAILQITLDARVKIRDGIHPAPDEYKSISYTTYMVKK